MGFLIMAKSPKTPIVLANDDVIELREDGAWKLWTLIIDPDSGQHLLSGAVRRLRAGDVVTRCVWRTKGQGQGVEPRTRRVLKTDPAWVRTTPLEPDTTPEDFLRQRDFNPASLLNGILASCGAPVGLESCEELDLPRQIVFWLNGHCVTLLRAKDRRSFGLARYIGQVEHCVVPTMYDTLTYDAAKSLAQEAIDHMHAHPTSAPFFGQCVWCHPHHKNVLS